MAISRRMCIYNIKLKLIHILEHFSTKKDVFDAGYDKGMTKVNCSIERLAIAM